MTRSNKSFITIVCASMMIAQARGQTQVDLQSQGRKIDFTNAPITKPVKMGASLPAVCETGAVFLRITAPPGENLYVCVATNVWVKQGAALPSYAGASNRLLTVKQDESGAEYRSVGSGLISDGSSIRLDTGLVPFKNADNTFSGPAAFSGTVAVSGAGSRLDASGAEQTMPVQSGPSLPASCAANKELFLLTSVSNGLRLYVCSQTGDGWVVVGDGNLGGCVTTGGDLACPGSIQTSNEGAPGALFLNEAADAGADYIELRAASSMSSPLTLVLPDTWPSNSLLSCGPLTDGVSNCRWEPIKSEVLVTVFHADEKVVAGMGAFYIPVGEKLDGFRLTGVRGHLATPANGATAISLTRCDATETGAVCSQGTADMLSTDVTFDPNEARSSTAAVSAVINPASADLAIDQTIRVDVISAEAGSQGLTLALEFYRP